MFGKILGFCCLFFFVSKMDTKINSKILKCLDNVVDHVCYSLAREDIYRVWNSAAGSKSLIDYSEESANFIDKLSTEVSSFIRTKEKDSYCHKENRPVSARIAIEKSKEKSKKIIFGDEFNLCNPAVLYIPPDYELPPFVPPKKRCFRFNPDRTHPVYTPGSDVTSVPESSSTAFDFPANSDVSSDSESNGFEALLASLRPKQDDVDGSSSADNSGVGTRPAAAAKERKSAMSRKLLFSSDSDDFPTIATNESKRKTAVKKSKRRKKRVIDSSSSGEEWLPIKRRPRKTKNDESGSSGLVGNRAEDRSTKSTAARTKSRIYAPLSFSSDDNFFMD